MRTIMAIESAWMSGVAMIRCRLLELMGKRGIRFLTRLSRETGVNRRTLAVLAENRMVRFDADVLARLCAYFACQPGDLLEYSAGEAVGGLQTNSSAPHVGARHLNFGRAEARRS